MKLSSAEQIFRAPDTVGVQYLVADGLVDRPQDHVDIENLRRILEDDNG